MTSQSQASQRRAIAADAHAIAEVQVHTWRQAYAGFVAAEFLQQLDVGRREEYRADAIGSLAEPDRPWVAESDGFLVGFVSLGSAHDSDDDRGSGEIYLIYVRPDNWNRGIGTDLMARAAADLQAHGYTSAALWGIGCAVVSRVVTATEQVAEMRIHRLLRIRQCHGPPPPAAIV